MRQLRSILCYVVVLMLALNDALPAADGCDPLWVKHVVSALSDATPEARQQAINWTEAFRAADDTVAQGMLRTVQARELKGLIVTFKRLRPEDVPFAGRDIDEQIREIYRSIGELTGPDYKGVPGLDGKIGHIVSDSPSNQKGALLDLRAADEVGLASKRPLSEGAGFEQTKDFRNPRGEVIAARQYDIVDPQVGSPFGGVCHESKNWPTGWTSVEDLDRFMDEFRRDILIHGQTNFAFYRLNFREATRPNLQALRTMLLQQFNSDLVTRNLDAETIQNARAQFLASWDAGPGNGLLHLF